MCGDTLHAWLAFINTLSSYLYRSPPGLYMVYAICLLIGITTNSFLQCSKYGAREEVLKAFDFSRNQYADAGAGFFRGLLMVVNTHVEIERHILLSAKMQPGMQ